MEKELAEKEATKEAATFDTRRVVNTLEGLMEKVTKKEVTPETVNAACNCATKITDILRVHLDVERLRMRMKGQK
jgi:NADH:ubiquinone oxidoreductase subunit B-like Fe-S oxidoreductase